MAENKMSRNGSQNPFKSKDGDWSVEKIVGAIVVAICLWMGTSIQSITISNAKMETTMEYHKAKLDELTLTFNTIAKGIKGEVDDVKRDLHAVRIEQGRRTGNVAKVELLEQKVSDNRDDIHQIDRRVTRIESIVPMD